VIELEKGGQVNGRSEVEVEEREIRGDVPVLCLFEIGHRQPLVESIIY
jgi:hypothetical protein